MNLRTQYTTWQEAVRAIVTQLLTMFDRARNWTATQSFNAGIAVGNGTVITKVLSATAILDFPNINSNSSSTLTMTVIGALDGDIALLAPPAALESGLVYVGRVSSADTVTVLLHNQSGSAIDPASATWRAMVISYA